MKKSLVSFTVLLSISGCGGGSSDSPSETVVTPPPPPTVTTAQGQFKVNNVQGLSYLSGEQKGVTDSSGFFTYEEGKDITFSIGAVTIGSTAGKTFITPVDLAFEGNPETVKVKNITRFLMMLDHDNNLQNGLVISEEVQEVAEGWAQPDFSSVNFESEVAAIISDASAADNITHELPLAHEAQFYLEDVIRCSYSGAFKGIFNGDDNGTLGIMVDAVSGKATGIAYSNLYEEYVAINGDEPISYGQKVDFVSGNTSTGATFNGTYSSVNEISGSWGNSNSGDSGEFLAERIGGVSNTAYRYTGQYSGDDYGLFSFDIDEANNVTGVAYSILEDVEATLTGTYSNNTLEVNSSIGAVIKGSLYIDSGYISGLWSNSSDSTSGSFVGNGCKLN